jgi:hypothetical protein
MNAGRNLAIEAGAGTGKTSTMVEVVKASPYRQFLYLAYNASTKAEAKRRFPGNARCVTGHGLAFGSTGKEFAHRLDAPRVSSRRAAALMGLREQRFAFCLHCQYGVSGEEEEHRGHPVVAETIEAWRIASLVKRTAERFCYSADRKISAFHAPWVRGTDERVLPQIREYVAGIAAEWWAKDLTSTEGKLWYWPDIYLKTYQLAGPRIGQRTVILDEAQDTNDCVWDIIRQQAGKQVIAVGDTSQMIYEWRGSKNVMELVENAARLQLTGSYRFGPAVAEEANKWLARLGASLRLRGYRRLDSLVTDQPQEESPDAVLYRSNAGCIAGAMSALDQGGQVAIVGGGGAVRALARAAQDLIGGRKTEHPELVGFETWQAVRDYCKEEPEDAGTLGTLVKVVDEHGPAAILLMADRLVSEEQASLVVSTAHKAKGREWNHVMIGSDFPQPVRQDLPAEEMRLAYVAVTRAKLVLERGSLSWIG